MKMTNSTQTNKMSFSHNILAIRRKEEELYQRMMYLNLTKGEAVHSLSNIQQISKNEPELKEKTVKELILSFI